MSGKLIVLEGLDGSGKATQAALLAEYLTQKGVPVKKITFPDYASDSSALVKMYLAGKFGTHPDDVNAYAASAFYAVDRFASFKTDWGSFYQNGGVVVADRYTTSNAVHQCSKLPEEEWPAYLDWLFHYEYDLLGLPRPDLVIYLDLPTELSRALRRQREESTGTHADIHEADEAYLRACRENAAQVVAYAGWQRIECAANGVVRTVEDIHREVWQLVEKLK